MTAARHGNTPVTSRRRLGRLADIPDGAARGFDAPVTREPLFVVRRGSVLHAWRDRCPHQGSRMAWRRHAYLNHAGDRIVCHAHGAQFDVASGRCLLGPALGQSLEAVAIELADDGAIYLAHDAADEARL
jgi:nitrite reductase/ring-hydroxylating ferredoxin subunit